MNAPLYIYHEIMHCLPLVITWIMGLNTFPEIVITQYPSYHINDDNSVATSSFRMHVSYINHFGFKWLCFLTTIMPLFGTLFLFIISPYYLYPYYLSNIQTLWLSVGDIRDLKAIGMKPPKILGRINLATRKWEKRTIWYYIPHFIRKWL